MCGGADGEPTWPRSCQRRGCSAAGGASSGAWTPPERAVLQWACQFDMSDVKVPVH